MSSPDEFDLQLRAALDLDQEERAYLSGLNLSGAWRSQAVNSGAPWGWLALVGVVSAFVAWTLLLEPFALALATANLVGLGTVAVTTAIGVVLDLGRTLFTLST